MIINDTLIQRIKDRVSIQEIVSITVILKRGGQYKWVGLCPFHNERTPSFYVFTAGKWINQYHCFGCGAHGDVINYIMEINGLSFGDAVQALADAHDMDTSDWIPNQAPKTAKPAYHVIAVPTVKKTFCKYESNPFILFLNAYFKDSQLVQQLIARYYIGTAKKNKTIFWLIDANGCVRTGQLILYDKESGKRSRTEPIQWVHSILDNFVMEQCFFGLHLLATESKTKTVAIVESPKTAILMSALMTDFIWLACCGKNGLSASKMEALKGRQILLYPDLGQFERKKEGQTKFVTAYELWCEQADLLQAAGYHVAVSDVLEKYVKRLPESVATNYITKGYDLADYAIDFDWYNEQRTQRKKAHYSKDDIDWFTTIYGSIENYETYLEQEKEATTQRNQERQQQLETQQQVQQQQETLYLQQTEQQRIIEKWQEKKELLKMKTDSTTLQLF